jgi:hypothetical protein
MLAAIFAILSGVVPMIPGHISFEERLKDRYLDTGNNIKG